VLVILMVLLVVTGFWAQSISALVNGATLAQNSAASAPIVALAQH